MDYTGWDMDILVVSLYWFGSNFDVFLSIFGHFVGARDIYRIFWVVN